MPRITVPDAPVPDDSITYITHRPQAVTYGQIIRTAFPFFRRHADGRYTDRTILSLANLSDLYEANRGEQDWLAINMPTLVTAEKPFEYDEVTEVKKGGTLGMAVVEARTRRLLIAVHQDVRRQKVGTSLYETAARRTGGGVVAWAGRNNISGQMFCLSVGLVPTALNSQGAIRYSNTYDEDE